jgi:hypothetical protein
VRVVAVAMNSVQEFQVVESEEHRRRRTKRIRHRVWVEGWGQHHHIGVLNQDAEIPRRQGYVLVHPVVQEATDRTVVGHQNRPNHVKMVGYYDCGQSKEGLEPPPVYQGVEGTIGRAVERMGGG